MTIFLPVKNALLRTYLSYLFEEVPNSPWIKMYKVSAVSDFGNVCMSFVRYASKPINTPEPGGKFYSDHPDGSWVCLILPQSERLANAPNYHLYYNAEDVKRLNSLLQIYFDLDFDSYYLAGLTSGEKQKHIIMSFVISRKLTPLLSDTEMLKKRQYRAELDQYRKRVKIMCTRAYDRHHRIKFQRLSLDVNIDKIIFS